MKLVVRTVKLRSFLFILKNHNIKKSSSYSADPFLDSSRVVHVL